MKKILTYKNLIFIIIEIALFALLLYSIYLMFTFVYEVEEKAFKYSFVIFAFSLISLTGLVYYQTRKDAKPKDKLKNNKK